MVSSRRRAKRHRPQGSRNEGRTLEAGRGQGEDQLIETVSGRDYRVAADGFWQVHEQAPGLLSKKVNSALSDQTQMITDLYCGVGLLGISAATATGARLYGVEGAKSAIENAKVNAKGLTANFDASRADRAKIPNSDVIILDPPRAGAGKAVTRALIESSATTIVYVSCDAATWLGTSRSWSTVDSPLTASPASTCSHSPHTWKLSPSSDGDSCGTTAHLGEGEGLTRSHLGGEVRLGTAVGGG